MVIFNNISELMVSSKNSRYIWPKICNKQNISNFWLIFIQWLIQTNLILTETFTSAFEQQNKTRPKSYHQMLILSQPSTLSWSAYFKRNIQLVLVSNYKRWENSSSNFTFVWRRYSIRTRIINIHETLILIEIYNDISHRKHPYFYRISS